ncbi:MAG: SDR family oxidoreductase [Candidatus Altiarchaeota archaeon]|nr:SDR family oxidoreductase [Candidatus Altiarchaeota archaeon]
MAKTVLITGASRGIGRAAAEYFSSRGWNVAASMRNPENWKGPGKTANTRVYRLDVTKPDTIDDTVKSVIKDYGRIDVLVNNAGYGVEGLLEAMTDDAIMKQFDTNVFGLMRVTRAVIPVMRTQMGGVIIQVSSMAGRSAFPMYSVYNSTKWAVEGFTESLQYELSQFNIRLKLIEPGIVKTDFYGRSREFVKRDDLDMYGEFVPNVDDRSMAAGEKGEPPERIAKAIYEAATDGSGRFRYPAGSPAPMLLALRRVMPERLFFRLIKQYYRI